MDVVQSHLISGEGIVWVGRPDPSRLLHRSDVAAIPFSLLWAGFSVYWEADVIAHGAPLAFTLFGAPFVLLVSTSPSAVSSGSGA